MAGRGLSHETRGCHHRNGDRLLDRRQHPGSACEPSRGEIRHQARGKICRDGISRSQVQGAPTLNQGRGDRSPRDALPRRAARRGITSPWSRRSRIPGSAPDRVSACPHRHHHGFRRTVRAHHRGSGRHHPQQGSEARRTVRRAEGDVVDGVGYARDLVQDQGRELFDLVGLRDLEPLHRQRL